MKDSTNRAGYAHRQDGRAGFSFVESLIILCIVTVIEGATILIADPWNRFQEARNVQRISNVNFITNGIYMNIVDHDGYFVCAAGPLPTAKATIMASKDGYDIAPCLVPKYFSTVPYDPGAKDSYYKSKRDYNTGYAVLQNSATGRIIVIAPEAELGQSIQVER